MESNGLYQKFKEIRTLLQLLSRLWVLPILSFSVFTRLCNHLVSMFRYK